MTDGSDYPDAHWDPSPNFTPANRGKGDITGIVIHDTEGGYAGAIATLKDPRPDNPKLATSAHYVISKTGDITQLVHESDIAWHAVNANDQWIGIEHEGFADGRGGGYTDAEYKASAKLVAELCEKYGIPKDRDHIMGHSEGGADWGGHQDPGPHWDWDKYMALVGGSDSAEDGPDGDVNVITKAMGDAAGTLIAAVATFWTSAGSPALADISTQKGHKPTFGPVGAVAVIQKFTVPLALMATMIAIAIAGVRMAWQRTGEGLMEMLKAVLTVVVVGVSGLGLVALLTAAGDRFSSYILCAGFGGEMADAKSDLVCKQVDGQPMTSEVLGHRVIEFITLPAIGGLAFGLVLILLLLLLIASMIQIILLVVRNAMLVLLACTLPLSASATNTELGRAWFQRSIGWLAAFLLFKPAASVIYATAFYLAGSTQKTKGGTDPLTVITGMLLLVLCVFALPALMRLVAPAVSGAAGGGGAALAIAGGVGVLAWRAATASRGGGPTGAGSTGEATGARGSSGDPSGSADAGSADGPSGSMLAGSGGQGSMLLDAQGNPIGGTPGAPGQLLGPDGRPINADGTSTDGSGRLLDAHGRPINADGTPAETGDSVLLGPDGKPINADGTSGDGSGQLLGPDGRPINADGTPVDAPPSGLLGPDGRPLSRRDADEGPDGASGRRDGAADGAAAGAGAGAAVGAADQDGGPDGASSGPPMPPQDDGPRGAGDDRIASGPDGATGGYADQGTRRSNRDVLLNMRDAVHDDVREQTGAAADEGPNGAFGGRRGGSNGRARAGGDRDDGRYDDRDGGRDDPGARARRPDPRRGHNERQPGGRWRQHRDDVRRQIQERDDRADRDDDRRGDGGPSGSD